MSANDKENDLLFKIGWANGAWQSDEIYRCPACGSYFSMVRTFDDQSDELGYSAPRYCSNCGRELR